MADSASVPLWFSGLSIALTFLGTAGGFLSAQFVELKRTEREREARAESRKTALQDSAEARRVALRDRRNQFQRETLLSLQDAALKYGRTHGAMNSLDSASIRETGKRALYPDDLNAEAALANSLTAVLGSRIADTKTRELLDLMKDKGTQSFMLPSQKQRDAALHQAILHFVALNERIGVILRQLDSDDNDDSGPR